MTNPVNLYSISRIREEEPFNRVEKHISERTEAGRTGYHEIESLRILVDHLTEEGLTMEDLDHFFFGFHIPQIGKEFDLLKFTDASCLNIELKSQEVPREQILAQLVKNRYYLSHLGKRLNLYTVVTNTMNCYHLSLNGRLSEVPLSEIVTAVQKHSRRPLVSIDELFRASEYLVSPIHTPKKFIQGEYFLTQAQAQVKREVLEETERSEPGSFFLLTGKPGTGKTLLIYDIAKALSKSGPTLVIHCGRLSEGQKMISEQITNLTITGEDGISRAGEFSFVLVDESHRMEISSFDTLCAEIREEGGVCIFSADPEQVMTKAARERDITSRIRHLPLGKEYILSEKIRMNKELQTFILQLRRRDFKPQEVYAYRNVDLLCAGTTAEAQNLLAYYRTKGYVFINYAKSSEADPYREFEEDFDPEYIVGQEYDRVIMLMDPSFYYDEEGTLQGVPGPDPDVLYPNLFYQGITRVREKLALIVLNAPELFRQISEIF